MGDTVKHSGGRSDSEYLIHVLVVLSNSPSVQEILWNFSQLEDEKNRLTLRENPHFFSKFPTSPDAYGDNLKIDPIEDFRHSNKFYVLTDRPELVHITTDQDKRVFGNFWCYQNAIILKGLGVLFFVFTCFLCLSRHLWEAQGGKYRQGISQRHTLWFL